MVTERRSMQRRIDDLVKAWNSETHGSLIADMVKRQFHHNLKQAGPEWHLEHRPWLRYMRVEMYELIGHYDSFKHWKSASPDLAQARIELVDAFIFAMSHAIETSGQDKFVERLAVACQEAESTIKVRRSQRDDAALAEDINQACESLVEVSFRGHVDLVVLAFLMADMGLTLQQFYVLYQAKMALNGLRSDNGYKQGTYHKLWFGREDNVVMQEALLDDPQLLASLMQEQDVQVASREVLNAIYVRVCEELGGEPA